MNVSNIAMWFYHSLAGSEMMSLLKWKKIEDGFLDQLCDPLKIPYLIWQLSKGDIYLLHPYSYLNGWLNNVKKKERNEMENMDFQNDQTIKDGLWCQNKNSVAFYHNSGCYSMTLSKSVHWKWQ